MQHHMFEEKPVESAPGVALERRHWIEEARRIAIGIAKKQGRVSSDDVRKHIEEPPHWNMWGPVFNDLFIRGSRVQSRRPEAKGRWIHYWILK